MLKNMIIMFNDIIYCLLWSEHNLYAKYFLFIKHVKFKKGQQQSSKNVSLSNAFLSILSE